MEGVQLFLEGIGKMAQILSKTKSIHLTYGVYELDK